MLHTPLGGICVNLGLMRVQEVHDVLARLAHEDEARFGEVALELGYLDEQRLALALAEQHMLNLLPDDLLLELPSDPELLEAAPRRVMRRYLVVPLFRHAEHRVVSTLTSDPAHLPSIRAIQQAFPGDQVRLFVGTRRGVRQLLDRWLGPPREGELESDPDEDARYARGVLSVGETLVLEPDPERVAPLRALQALGDRPMELVTDPEQVVPLLQTWRYSRLCHRPGLENLVKPYEQAWLRVRPDLEIAARPLLAVESHGHSDRDRVRRFFTRLVELGFLGSESRDVDARIRIKRTMEVARGVASQLGLPANQVDNVALASLLVELDHLAFARFLVQDRQGLAARGRGSSVARTILDTWAAPEDLDRLVKTFEQRVRGGGPIGHHLGAEVVFTVRAVVRYGRPGETDPARILGEDVYHHLPRVLGATADVLRWEASSMDSVAFYGGRREVLLAVRTPDLLTGLELALEEQRYRVLVAGDGEMILRQARFRRPACVVMDFRLPGTSGIELLQRLAEDRATSGIPVLVLAESEPGPQATSAFEAGAEDVLVRSAGLSLMVAKIRRVIEAGEEPENVGLRGQLRELPLPDLIQTLTLGGRTAAVRIRVDGGHGELYIVRGQLGHAWFGDLVGEEAFRRLVALDEGRFEVEFEVYPPSRNLHGSSEWMLLEALRMRDEHGQEE